MERSSFWFPIFLLLLSFSLAHGQANVTIIDPTGAGAEPLSGIGAVISDQSGQTVLGTVLNDSGAQAAGLLPGDVILNVNGVDVAGMELNAVVNLIRGKADTTVLLRVSRSGTQPFDVIVTRHLVKVPQ